MVKEIEKQEKELDTIENEFKEDEDGYQETSFSQ